MAALHFLLPGDPATRTGGFIYDACMIARLRAAGRTVTVHALPDDFPFPSETTLARAERVLAALPEDATVVLDGLALGAMPALAERHAGRLRLIALVHHPLAKETGLSAAQSAALFESERAALAAARGVITSSAQTARSLEDYGVAAARVRVAVPGVEPAPLARGSAGKDPTLLCVASLVPRKGHIVLLEALARLRDRPWCLVCVGSTDRHPATAEAVARRARTLGLSERVAVLGELDGDALDAAYDAADLFVLASHYEGYGMVFAEALMRGLPVIACRGGATAETLPADAALLVPAGDPEALAGALARAIDEPALRRDLAAGARRARDALPSWEAAGAGFGAALDALSA